MRRIPGETDRSLARASPLARILFLVYVVLVAYAFLVVQSIGLAPAAALISLVTFFFLCTLVEPLVLRT